MDAIADFIDRVLRARGDQKAEASVRAGRGVARGALPALPGASRVKCPFCGHTEDRVVDSRVGRDGSSSGAGASA